MLISQISKARLTKGLVVLALMVTSVAGFAQLQTAVQVVTNTNNAAANSQNNIDRLSDQTEELLVQYRTVLSEIESLTVYNQQLEAVVNDQNATIQSMNEQMAELESTNRAVVPMVIEMVDMLRKIIEADIPFYIDTRLQRVVQLENMLDASNVTTSEKYRKVTEAYQIELDYGRSVSTYSAEIEGGVKVNFLQIGRTALLYQTLDEKKSGWWNTQAKRFEELPEQYNSAIKEGIRIAAKQAAPNLVGLPILFQASGE
jgi:chromosome segregation ATPase